MLAVVLEYKTAMEAIFLVPGSKMRSVKSVFKACTSSCQGILKLEFMEQTLTPSMLGGYIKLLLQLVSFSPSLFLEGWEWLKTTAVKKTALKHTRLK